MSDTGKMQIGLGGYKATGDQFKVRIGFLRSGEEADVTASLYVDGTKLPVTEAEFLGDSDEGTDYALLVDVSGSMSQASMDEAKDVLKAIADGMKAEDRASLMLMGNDVSVAEFTSDKDKLLEAIDGMEISHEDTNLYYAVDKALTVLEADGTNYGKCLVVISDGDDEQMTGITREEAVSHAKDAHIPVYTVAVSFPSGNDDKAEMAKILGNFARVSPAGLHQVIGVDDLTAAQAGEVIMSHISGSVVLSSDTSELSTSKAEVYVEAVAENDAYGIAKDGYTMPASAIINNESEDAEDVKTVTETTKVVEMTESPAADHNAIYICGIIILLAVVTGFIIKHLSDKKKKGKKQSLAGQNAGGMGSGREEKAGAVPVIKDTAESQNMTDSSKCIAVNDIHDDNAAELGRRIYLTQIGHSKGDKLDTTVYVDEPVIIGRNANHMPVSINKDAQISGSHARIFIKDGSLFIEDMNSTNGTFVNGVPVNGPYCLTDNDKLSFGDNEWRINF